MNLKEFIIDTFIDNSIEWDDSKVDRSLMSPDYANRFIREFVI